VSVWTSTLPYFPAKELACKCCGIIKIDIEFAAMLPALRATWDKPLTPTSVCRCPKHNEAVGGHKTSFHLTENLKWNTAGSMAADISWASWETAEKLRFARMAHSLGLRVGLHNSFCHIDGGRSLGANPRPFVYGQWANHFGPEDVL
jgi:hypothetical protein